MIDSELGVRAFLAESVDPPGALIGSPTGQLWRVSAALPISYDVRLSYDILDPENDILKREVFAGASGRRLIVMEQKVYDLFGKLFLDHLHRHGLRGRLLCVVADEAVKDSRLAHRIIEAIDDFGIDRRGEPIVVMGGGVLLDIVGWVASVYRRGTPYIRIPTTLIGLVDAGVGVKTGVNHNGQKNVIGAYHPPVLVLLDPKFLATLPTRHISNGIAEIVKMGLMCDETLWKLVAAQPGDLIRTAVGYADEALQDIGREVMVRAVHSMLIQLQPNLWEKDLQRLVDFGHTFSPSLEMAVLPELLHGEAVSVDMAVSCALSAQRGILDDSELTDIIATLLSLGLPVNHFACTPELLEHSLRQTIQHRGGKQRMPVPIHPGSATFLDDVTVDELGSAVRRVRQLEDITHAHR